MAGNTTTPRTTADVLLEEVAMPVESGRVAWRVSTVGYSVLGLSFDRALGLARMWVADTDGRIYRQPLDGLSTLFEPTA